MENPPQPEPAAETKPPRKYSWQGFKAGALRKARTVKTYAVEIFNEHDLWVEALAVKGGASAVVAAGIVGISYVIALPFMVAATGIAVCGALIGLGIYGMAAGGARAWDSLRGTIARIRGHELPPHKQGKPKRNIFQRLQNTKLARKIFDSKIAKKVTATRTWQVSEKFMRRSEESILGSLALGGAVATLAVGAALLATQVLVLPIVAIGATATFVAVESLTMIASGIYGLYLCYDNFRHRRAAKEAAGAQETSAFSLTENGAALAAKASLKKAPKMDKVLAEDFAKKAANTNAAPVAPPAEDNIKAQPATTKETKKMRNAKPPKAA